MYRSGNRNSYLSRILPVLLLLLPAAMFTHCTGQETQADNTTSQFVVPVKIKADLSWSERMALSIMKRNPKAWMTDFQHSPQWSYTNGLIMHSFLELWEKTGKKEYYNYAKSYADTMIDKDGNIRDYDVAEFNIDHINPGKILFTLYRETGDSKYDKAIHTLRNQLEWQPRTRDGGFWHKLRYPWQMWLDGLYMGAPFYAQYAVTYDQVNKLDDVLLQFRLIEEHTRDANSGLLYHGWDESHVQRWASPETGCSPHFWGRAMGWYGMAMVDVYEQLPQSSPGRTELSAFMNSWIDAITSVQDSETGVWYQILDSPDRDGNYLEATASCMFVYAILKAINLGMVDASHIAVAKKGFDGILENFIEVEDSGEIHLHKCCSVAGLGGSPYRDGSFEYYISEKVRSNDPKGTGPFILAVLELEKYEKSMRR